MGIGREIALAYASEGANVVVADINERAGKEVVAELTKKGYNAIFIKTNTANPAEQESLVKETVKHFGGLHIACNNAAISAPTFPVTEYPLDVWDNVLSINLSGVFYGMRYQIPAMLASGGGSIVNISAMLGQVGKKNTAAHVATKHGVVGLTKAVALEYAEKNIRVNVVGPSYIKTPMLTNAFDEEGMKALEKLIPMGRLGKASEVAELVLWLSSPKSSFVTGSFYAVDGGYLAQ
ncbi:MAG: short-chain dehydrogenase [Candidatus Staskawiczbacteria bacterium RIFCSPLOWO2_01_FULL_33_9]|uniref:Short-chain dehydrogenase n=1 Tax=Candidatus Staskawiczbacteria bacterium RIFCSPLOWO2_01_FULL_33_9 TaxID=1802211 RepID=A0A1G2I7G6_9BACT|nr:MAG: short-chain dehydrogenase [Candidatus Staskawiczbacteria bacterium RIFCSPLOWO2_01_FULL_33_9]